MKPILSKGLNSADAAIQWFRVRVPMTEKKHRNLDASAKRKAFYISGVSQLRMVSDVFDAMKTSMEHGESFHAFKKAVSAKLRAAWGGDRPHRVENIFRTNIQRAYMAGRIAEIRDPAVRRMRPYLRYDGILDDAVCPICEPWDGVVLPEDDPRWNEATPPMHFQCRCTLVSLSQEEAEEDGITDDASDLPEPLEGFGDPPSLDDVETEDLTGVDPELMASFHAKSIEG